MTNASTVADLKRVQRGLIQRAPKWDALTSNMQNAAAEALRQINSVSQAMGSFLYLANPIDMGTMENVAFSRATISGLPIGAIASPTGPIMHGFFWFQAIFIAKYGHEQNPYKIVESRLPVGSGPSSFDDLRLPSKSTQHLSMEFERLIKIIESEKAELSTVDADKAISAMLLAPILFPPLAIPSVEEIEVRIEWCEWQVQMRNIAESLYLEDLEAKIYENPKASNLDVLFKRLGDLIMSSYNYRIKLENIPEFADLAGLRRGLDKRTITRGNFEKGLPAYEIPVSFNFPPLVNTYLKAHGFEETQKIYLNSNRMTFAQANL